jgi:hypothetical protein
VSETPDYLISLSINFHSIQPLFSKTNDTLLQIPSRTYSQNKLVILLAVSKNCSPHKINLPALRRAAARVSLIVFFLLDFLKEKKNAIFTAK